MTILFERVALVGIGHIGSSISHGMRLEKIARHIAGYARSEKTRETAQKLGLVDSIHASAADAVKDADLVILCVPVGAMGQAAAEMAKGLKPGCLVTDVGSVKCAVIRDVMPHLPQGVHFVPGHPIAGTEQSGPQSGFAELFHNRWCIITPPRDADPKAVEKLQAFWRALKSNVEVMTPEHHDMVLAITSHLPHLIAYNIVATAADLEEVTDTEVIKYSAGGFRDFTRIAASDPTMWRDVFLLQRAIRWDDGDTLFDLFTRSRDVRRNIIAAGQETPAPNFGRDVP
jgi:cyclohexadieny/prephenate dehydrogenase